MKKAMFLAILAVVLSTGCATRSTGNWGGMSRLSLTPPLLTVVASNNTRYMLAFEENGQPVTMKDQAGTPVRAYLAPGGTGARGFYNFMGSRQIVITVKAFCPTTGIPARVGAPETGCTAGEYIGMDSRSFYLYSGQDYRSEDWVINSVRAARSNAY